MTINHHPDEGTLLTYAAGHSNEATALVVAAHLEFCRCCSTQIEQLGGATTNRLAPTRISDSGPGTVREKAATSRPERLARAGEEPDSIQELSSDLWGNLNDLPWRTLVPGIRQHKIPGIARTHENIRLLAFDPGTKIPRHGHRGTELTLVLQGSYVDEFGRYGVGDLAELDDTVFHQPSVDAAETCVCLVATN